MIEYDIGVMFTFCIFMTRLRFVRGPSQNIVWGPLSNLWIQNPTSPLSQPHKGELGTHACDPHHSMRYSSLQHLLLSRWIDDTF